MQSANKTMIEIEIEEKGLTVDKINELIKKNTRGSQGRR